MSQSVTQDVFNATPFASGDWGSGGFDGVGFYSGGSAGSGTAMLTGTATSFGDPIVADLDGVTITLFAYADVAGGSGGVVLTSQDFSVFYVFLGAAFDPAAIYALDYGFGGFAAPCFAGGTRIATARGEVAVEALRVGDRVVAMRCGRFAPITWIGRRRVDCRNHARGHDLWPVRVAAGAFAIDMPHRDLLLSPDHAVYVEGALVPVRYLLNGATIVQPPVASVTYWHVELAAHDVLLAEGLPVESYLDTGNRAAFDVGDARRHSHPVLARRMWQERACAPLHTEAALHLALRQRLHARAGALGHATTDDPDLVVLADDMPVPVVRDGFSWQARLPAGTRNVRLVSRISVPGEILPEGGDHRRLGVAVLHLTLDGDAIPPGRRTTGWHAPEPPLHWTDGAATLECEAGCARMLDITVAPLPRYWLPLVALEVA